MTTADVVRLARMRGMVCPTHSRILPELQHTSASNTAKMVAGRWKFVFRRGECGRILCSIAIIALRSDICVHRNPNDVFGRVIQCTWEYTEALDCQVRNYSALRRHGHEYLFTRLKMPLDSFCCKISLNK